MNSQLNNSWSSKDPSGLPGSAVEGDLLKEGASALANSMVTARSRGEATLDDARKALARKARQAADVSTEFVKENPWKTIGVVAAIGLVVGVLLNRRGRP